MITNLPAFFAVAAVVIVTPGPDTALTIRNTLLGGRAGGVFTAIGVSCGQATWALATSIGVAALLHASELLFVALKIAGAAYLVFLGLQAVRAGLMRRPPETLRLSDPTARRQGPRQSLRQGLLSNLGNPKMAVFFTSLLPQFVSHGHASFLALLALGCVFSLMTLSWLTGYAFAVARIGNFLRRPTVRRTVEGLTGFVLIGLGLRLAAERG
jgi:threonine/homoserine/homoserine lactone efflux protein